MSKCQTCKWWGESGREVWRNPHVQFCDNPDLLSVEHMKNGYASIPHDGYALDYPVCDLVTGPDFGCHKWTANAVESSAGRQSFTPPSVGWVPE